MKSEPFSEEFEYAKPDDLDNNVIGDFCDAVEKSMLLRKNISAERFGGDIRPTIESIAWGFRGLIDSEESLSDSDYSRLKDICSALNLTKHGYHELVTLFLQTCIKDNDDDLYRTRVTSTLKRFLVNEDEEQKLAANSKYLSRKRISRPKQLSADFTYLAREESRENSIVSQPIWAPTLRSDSSEFKPKLISKVRSVPSGRVLDYVEPAVTDISSRGSKDVSIDWKTENTMLTPSVVEDQTKQVLELYTKSFLQVDEGNTGRITLEEFKKALELVKEKKPNFQTSQVPAEYIFKFFLQPGTNTIAYDEFLRLMATEAAGFHYGDDQDLRVEVYKYSSVKPDEQIINMHHFPNSNVITPYAVQEYSHQALQMEKRVEQLHAAETRSREMELNINLLEVEKCNLQNDMQILRSQLKQLHDENAQERASVRLASIEKKHFEDAIRSRETKLIKVQKLYNATRDELETERQAKEMHMDLWQRNASQWSEKEKEIVRKEKEIKKLRAQLRRVKAGNRKDTVAEMQNLRLLLKSHKSSQEKVEALEAINNNLQEQLRRVASPEVWEKYENKVVRFVSTAPSEANTEAIGDPLTLDVELSQNIVLFNTSLPYITIEEKEDMARSIVKEIIRNVRTRPRPEIYEVEVTSQDTLGFIIWKNDSNNNAMVMKTSQESANNGIKVGSWVFTVNGRYVDGLPFERILRTLRKANAKRPLRIGFRDDPQTRSLNYVDKLENENRVKNYEIQRIHMKYGMESQVNEGWMTRAQQRRLEKNENCIIQ